MSPQAGEHLLVEPALVAKLEGRRRPVLEQAQKTLQPRHILLEIRRQLEQQRPEFFLQNPGHAQKVSRRLVDLFQPFEMRNQLRRLETESKARRHLGRPRLQQGRGRHAVVRVVHFAGGKMLSVVAQHLLGWHFFRVKRPFPLLVAEPARADEEFHQKVSVAHYVVSRSTPPGHCPGPGAVDP